MKHSVMCQQGAHNNVSSLVSGSSLYWQLWQWPQKYELHACYYYKKVAAGCVYNVSRQGRNLEISRAMPMASSGRTAQICAVIRGPLHGLRLKCWILGSRIGPSFFPAEPSTICTALRLKAVAHLRSPRPPATTTATATVVRQSTGASHAGHLTWAVHRPVVVEYHT